MTTSSCGAPSLVARLAVRRRRARGGAARRRRASAVSASARHVRADFGEVGAAGQVARQRVQEHAPAQPAQRRGERRGIARVDGDARAPLRASAQSNGASSVAASHVALVRMRGERRGRVAAVGEGGGEVGAVGIGAGGRVGAERHAGAASIEGRPRRSATMRQRLHYAFRARHPPRSRRDLPSRWPASSGLVVVVGFARVRAGAARACASSSSRRSSRTATTLAAALSRAARAAGRDRRARDRLGRLESEARRRRLPRAATARARRATPLLDAAARSRLIVSWTSLPLLELRLKELIIERPRLAIRRDRAGHAAHRRNRVRSRRRSTGDSPLTDWMLRQREIVIRDALITWDDDLRNAPQLVLDHVQFRLENRFGRHRFGLRGTPPAELAAPIDLRGDFAAASTRATGSDGEGHALRAPRLRRRRARGANGCRCRCRSPAARARCASGSSSPSGEARERRRRPRARGRAGAARRSAASARPRASLRPRRLARTSPQRREISTRDLAFVTIDGTAPRSDQFHVDAARASTRRGNRARSNSTARSSRRCRELAIAHCRCPSAGAPISPASRRAGR